MPILPVTIIGTREILPADSLRMHPGTVDLTVHAPVVITGEGDAAVEEAIARSRTAIASVGDGYLELT